MSVPVRAPERSKPLDLPFRRSELLRATAYGITLLWINVYICRGFFFNQTAYMHTMHGFWAALAKHAGGNWLQASWWPHWDCGIPLDFTYAPLVPVLTALCAGLRGIPHLLAFQSITAFAYCLVPLTLFLMAWQLTRAPGYSFSAALFYSLTAPTQLVMPDTGFSLANLWDPHRFYLVAMWDDTPHLLALAFLPFVILFLSLSIREQRIVYYGPRRSRWHWQHCRALLGRS